MGKTDWKTLVGAGLALFVVGALIGQSEQAEVPAKGVALVGAVLVAAGLVWWWVQAQAAEVRKRRARRRVPDGGE